MANSEKRVIVVGAGPVGAIMTLALLRKGIPVLLIEAEPEPVEDQRAATIHAPTLEMLANLGLKQQAFAEDATGGFQAPLFQFRDRATGELVATFDIRLLDGEVPYPFVLQWEQYKLVRAVMPLLAASGLAELRFATNLIGTDGGRSTVRRFADIDFEGFTWEERFIKIATSFDFVSAGTGYCTRNYFSDPDEWLNLFKVKGNGPPGYWRGIMPVPPNETDEQAVSMEAIQRRLHGIYDKSGDFDIPYYALYTVHQRVAATFNKGRVLLAGDAAHVNNPIGGMGMNGGIHDAVNLADKLADVWFGRADASVLDRYTRQRRKAQTDFVQAQSIQNKKTLGEKDPAVRRQHLDELRRTSEDVARHKAFLYRSSLIDSLNAANAVE